MTSSPPSETQVRRLLSRTWMRRRRNADFADVQNAHELDLNREFEDRHDGSAKYFFLVTLVFALLVYAVSQALGLK